MPLFVRQVGIDKEKGRTPYKKNAGVIIKPYRFAEEARLYLKEATNALK